MKAFVLIIFFSLSSQWVWSEEYSAIIHNVNVVLVNGNYELNAEFDYRLSPIAKEALQKGIPITWHIIIKVQKLGLFWNTTLQKQVIAYQIQNHTLLNLYSVKNINSGTIDMYSTFNAALNSISNIRSLTILKKQLIAPNKRYQIAIQVQFDRENLPVPLRPLAYFNSDWKLSSDWSLWHLQN